MLPAEKIKQSERRTVERILAECGDTLQNILDEFAEETGYSIKDIDFYLADAQEMGRPIERTVVTGVRISF